MRFSTKSEYGLRAIINLAKHQKKQPYSLAKIAHEEKISLAYLERLFAKLKKAGLVISTKGVKGGYKLGKSLNQISVRDILSVLEGSLAAYTCAGLKCSGSKKFGCQAQFVWHKLDQEINKTLESIKLSELIK